MTETAAVAIVTGGSRGIGRAIAAALAATGHRIVLSYRDRTREADAVVAQIRSQGGEAHAVRADVGHPAEADGMVRAALDAFGQIDVLVNNAGVDRPGIRLADLRWEDWELILRVNLSGPFRLIQAVPVQPLAGTAQAALIDCEFINKGVRERSLVYVAYTGDFGNGTCRVEWYLALETRGLSAKMMWMTRPLMRLANGWMFGRFRRYVEDYAAKVNGASA